MIRVIDPTILEAAQRNIEAAPYGQRSAVVAAEARLLGISPQGLRAKLSREMRAGKLFEATRKRRSDAGRSVITPKDLEIVAGYMAAGIRENGKASGDLETSLQLAQPHISPEAADMSLETWRRQLRLAGISLSNLVSDGARRILVSKYPNHWHLLDATVSWRFYWRPKGGVGVRDLHMLDPQNKPENAAAIADDKNKLILYTLTDHCSGVIFPRYDVARGENSEGVLRLLWEAWRDKHDSRFPFRGIPKYLYSDKGAANMSSYVDSLCSEFDIRHIAHGTKNAPAVGQVEKAHNIIQNKFEFLMRFKHTDDLDKLNAMLYQWTVWFCGMKRHSRHGHTRTAHWASYIREEHLRLVPEDQKDFYSFAYSYAVKATVRSNRTFKAFGDLWMLPDGCNWAKGARVLVRRLPFAPDQLRTKRADTLEEVIALRRKKDPHGFPLSGAMRGELGGGIQPVTPTAAETIRKDASVKTMIERYGEFDSLEALTSSINTVAFPSRKGTPVKSETDLQPRPISLFEAKLRLADILSRPLEPDEAALLEERAENGCIDERLVMVVLDTISQSDAARRVTA